MAMEWPCPIGLALASTSARWTSFGAKEAPLDKGTTFALTTVRLLAPRRIDLPPDGRDCLMKPGDEAVLKAAVLEEHDAEEEHDVEEGRARLFQGGKSQVKQVHGTVVVGDCPPEQHECMGHGLATVDKWKLSRLQCCFAEDCSFPPM
eukprot:1158070-Pelagomonas_calceolata.AAC.1